jgi:TolA-binding protein
VYDSHALYLLARVRHRGGRLAEARKSYEKVLAEYAKQRKQPEAKGTDPEHVARAAFFLGAIDEEEGRYAEALAAFEAFAKQYPGSSLLPDAALRRGLCLVEMKRYAEAQKILKLLADGEPRLADQALAGLARAQVGAADPAKAAEYDATLKAAADAFRQAAEKAHQAERTVPAAKTRRGEILLQLAGVQQLAKQFKEAAATYQSIESEKLLPSGDEETAPGLAAAFQLAGDYQNADQVCTRFQQAHPKSPLLAEVLFRYAESAALQLQAAQKLTDSAAREREVTRLADETGRRYADILSKFPKHPSAHLARCGLGLAHYHKGDLAKARSNLAAIPAADRTGELAVVPYYLADIQIRTLPKPADELAGALRTAADQLEGFIAAQPDGPLTPDALVKLGYCRQRLAGLAAKPDERAKALADARAAYEQVTQRFPKHELMPRAFLERARTLADAGDVGSALTELRRFTADPLKAAPVAPMGLLHLATLLRGQGKAAEAEQVLDQCRKDHENALKADPARSAWLPVLQYQHGLALREVGKSNEARAVFEGVFNQWPDRSEACESALRSGQCLADSGRKKLADAAAKLAAPDLKPEAQAAGRQLQADGVKDLQEAENYLTTRAEQLKAKHASSEARCRMLYEAAWVTRALSAVEVEAARAKARQELWQKKKEEVAKQTPAGADPPPVPIPVLPANAVPLQPAEVRTRGHYHTLIGNFPDSATATDSRFELAELLSERGEHDAAVKLLNEALAKRPALADKVNVRLGECLFAKGDFRGALAKFEPVAADPKSEAAPAAYRAGECLMRLGDHAGAVKHFAAFRDRPAFQKISGLTDRALLRLGHALGRLGQWDASRQALELVVANFGDGLWAGEARYGIGWALQNKGDYDGAVAAYARVAVSLSETGARARLNTGLCRLAQKRYAEAAAALLVVPYTYDYPQLNALALLEAARALAENKQGEEAARLLKRLLRDYPATAEAEAARKRLEELTKG